ncbi:MAG: hypothetical protein JSR73_01725 [Proteobacteria bacterium]|nr:hypothetical protein [Pseudomonadota bacterium]
MRRPIHRPLPLLLLLTITGAAQATDPPAGTNTSANATSTPPPAAAPSAPAAPTAPTATTPAAAATASPDAAEIAQFRSLGYRPEQRHGETYYCRNEAEIGSRFERKVCATIEQLRARRQASRDMLESMQKLPGNPSGK